MRIGEVGCRCPWAGWLLALALLVPRISMAAGEPSPQVGLAVRDITPDTPIRLAGNAGRKKAADRVEHPLLVQALALKNASGERFVFVALDNCEVSRAFMEPVLRQLADQFQLAPGTVAVVSSHTHSGPVLSDTLTTMSQGSGPENERIANYSRLLQGKLVDVVGAALADCQPASFEQGTGRICNATSSMEEYTKGVAECKAENEFSCNHFTEESCGETPDHCED